MATAACELRTQVALTSRELLKLPEAALRALAAHEAAHMRTAAASDAARHEQALAELETQRAQHAAALSPALSHPARHAELEALRTAEGARCRAAMAAAKESIIQSRRAVPERAVLAEQRMDAAARQLADLLASVLLPQDLVAAPPSDASLADLPPLALEQLRQLESDVAAVAASAAATNAAPPPEGAAAGRPFAMAAPTLPLAALLSNELGWSARHDALLATATAAAAAAAASGEGAAAGGKATTGSSATGFVEPAEGRSAEPVAVLLAPVPCAVLRTCAAALRELEHGASQALAQALAAAEDTVSAEQAWQRTWTETLDRMAPAAAPGGLSAKPS